MGERTLRPEDMATTSAAVATVAPPLQEVFIYYDHYYDVMNIRFFFSVTYLPCLYTYHVNTYVDNGLLFAVVSYEDDISTQNYLCCEIGSVAISIEYISIFHQSFRVAR